MEIQIQGIHNTIVEFSFQLLFYSQISYQFELSKSYIHFRVNGNNKAYKEIITNVDRVVMDDDDLAEPPPFDGLETDLDDESFRSDLERDSAHSSLVNQVTKCFKSIDNIIC